MNRYILVCRECDPDGGTPIPFACPEDRGKWAAEHRDGTGHDRWIVLDTVQDAAARAHAAAPEPADG